MMKCSNSTKRPSWTKLDCPPTPRLGHTSILYKNYMISFGGSDDCTYKPYGFSVLNLETDRFEHPRIVGDHLTKRDDHCACLMGENKIAIFGGEDKRQHNLYDVAVLTLNDDPELTIHVNQYEYDDFDDDDLLDFSVCYNTMHYYENRLFVFGGSKHPITEYSNGVWYFEFGENEWYPRDVTGEIPSKRAYHSGVSYKSRMYVFGGLNQAKQILNDFYELNLENIPSVWQKVACTGTIPSPRVNACMVENNGKLYLFGGENHDVQECYNDLFEYNIETKVWKKIETANSIKPRTNATGVWYDGHLVIWGGYCSPKIFSDIQKIKLDMGDEVEEPDAEDRAAQRDNEYKLQMKELLVNREFSDICFKVQDQQFHAHKAVLSVRCKYFQNMFQSGMTEAQAEEIKITDVDPPTFKALLEYTYCNMVELTESLALDLLKLADKWSFTALKSECEEFLAKQLTLDNFKEFVAITRLVDATFLGNAITDFAIENFQKLRDAKCLSGLSQPMFVHIIDKVMKQEAPIFIQNKV